LGAVGVPLLGALLLWLVAGRGQRGASAFESSTLSIVLVSLVMWFALSQQSRYIVSLAPPLSVLAAGAVLRLRAGALLGFVAAAQALFTLWLAHFMLVSTQLQIVTGRIDRQQYVEQTTPFAAMAPTIDREVGEGKVALYDEVFGYFLEARYVWANPGHSTLIPYASLETGPDFADELSRQSFTHVFVSMSPIVRDPEFARRWIEAMGLNGAVTPLPEQETLKEGFQTRWIVLLADAVAKGRLRPVAQERAGILFEVAPN
ncbi:MAG TPA: hypothetical protein VM328_09415, partial [Fimbriimonadaceae bacterium]|nr:hypothetical protein [Fimbriimonadaceae bacterium]